MAYREQAAALNVGALLAGFAALALSSVAFEPATSWDVVTILLLLILAAIAWVGFALWRDTYLFLKHASTASLFALGFAVLGWLSSGMSNAAPMYVCGAIVVALFVGLWSCSRYEGRYPHVLMSQRDLHPVFEFEGIHVSLATPRAVSAGSNVPVSFYLENCWSGPREVVIQFLQEYEVSGIRLKTPKRIQVKLQAGEVGRADFSIHMPAGVQGKRALLTHFTVRGLKGRRFRMWRAHEFRNKVSLGEQAAHLALGEFTWGGGLHLQWDVAPARDPQPEEPGPDAVSWKVLWSELSREPTSQASLLPGPGK
ncbi:hypothetical protein ATI61_113246 [Archangium gephyra]|uniref:Uncharacterized protein n=1 Tax=Archangium gephyra TaxID=48 RepID=A0AAC8TEK6_9BACT|nr:hypothetical protein [Archangium gephyra]AKJ03058.1 Hypothetical protein AA314_04684 [Archangium gephyra]REG25182.1 hypothetical protein ATI61_113246 [Archangium gephyra]